MWFFGLILMCVKWKYNIFLWFKEWKIFVKKGRVVEKFFKEIEIGIIYNCV